MTTQLNALQRYVKDQNLDFAYLSDPTTISYFSGYEGEPHERVLGLVVFPEAAPFLFTPALDAEDARNSGWSDDIYSYQDHQKPWEMIAEQIKQRTDGNDIAIEKDHLTVDRYESLQDALGSVQAADITPEIQKIKVIKSEDELKKMQIAGDWADKALEIGFAALHEGVTEKEVVAEIEYQLKKLGNEGMSFETIVLFGDHAASPHGVPGDRKLKREELVLFDLGCAYKGYMSDTSRTIAFGTPSDKAREIYDIVLQAQTQAIESVRPGVTAEEVDRAARSVIENAGYGEYFTHRLGHGIGKSIHEFPNIMEGNPLVLKEGMCFSIEPGIYLPEVAGVRIEDCFVVTKNGCEPFTQTPKQYREI